MIFVDANVFLRHLIQPMTSQDRVNAGRAAALFRSAEEDSVEITTSEAILAEVVFILSDARHYNFPRTDVRLGVQSLLRSRGFKLMGKDACMYAFDIWVAYPKLSYPDALGAAYSELRGHELATFDATLARTPGVIRYTFDQAGETPSEG